MGFSPCFSPNLPPIELAAHGLLALLLTELATLALLAHGLLTELATHGLAAHFLRQAHVLGQALFVARREGGTRQALRDLTLAVLQAVLRAALTTRATLRLVGRRVGGVGGVGRVGAEAADLLAVRAVVLVVLPVVLRARVLADAVLPRK